MKVWEPGEAIADAARRLQSWWVDRWTTLVPQLMTMKPDADDCAKPGYHTQENLSDDAIEYCANVNNERADDYQEQIGMPDEENMRQWSHHHRTDTVDDPVFRAAMRGCDAVSFVFGLEVTWSLIQQRQQEEEERIAMEELNCVKEVDEGQEDDDSNDENVEPDKSSIVNDRNQEPGRSDGCTTGDNTSVLKNLDGNSCLPKSSKPGVRNASLSSSQSTDCSLSVCSSAETGDDWSCAACTLMNKKTNRKCSACGTRRPTLTSSRKRSIEALI